MTMKYLGHSNILNKDYEMTKKAFDYIARDAVTSDFTPSELSEIVLPGLVEEGDNNLSVLVKRDIVKVSHISENEVSFTPEIRTRNVMRRIYDTETFKN